MNPEMTLKYRIHLKKKIFNESEMTLKYRIHLRNKEKVFDNCIYQNHSFSLFK